MKTEPIQKIRRPGILQKTFVLVGTALIGILFSLSPWGRQLEYLCYDTLFLLRGERPAPEQVVVVAIDEPSFGAFGQAWPWPRTWHARLIDTLFAQGAGGVVVDILFSEPGDGEEDAALAKSVRGNENCVLAAAVDVIDTSEYRQQAMVLPATSIIDQPASIGIINMPPDSDGFIRRGITAFGEVPSLFKAGAMAVKPDGEIKAQREAGGVENPVMANYYGPPRTIKTVSYYQAMAPERYLPTSFFRDKLVFIGLSLQATPEQPDRGADHFSYPFTRQNALPISGVEIQATLAANLLNEDHIRMLPAHNFISVLFWMSGLMALILGSPKRAYLLTAGLMGVTCFFSYGIFASGFHSLPLVFTLFPVVVAALVLPFFEAVRLGRDKRKIRRIFSRYLSPKVVAGLLENPERLTLGGHMADATVLHLDIEGFSRMSAGMPPERLVDLLSRYLGAFTEAIFEYDGMVDKYVGDAIMAVWGVPVPQPDHAALACRAAIEIRKRLELMQQEDAGRTGPSLEVRIGVSSGPMLAGNVGGKRFLNYTVHGEAANLAVRLEALNKEYGTRILICHETAVQLDDQFITRKIESVTIDGQSSPVTVYELVANKDLGGK